MARNLHPNLKAWFDSRCLYPHAWPFIAPMQPAKMLLVAVKACVGIQEQGGDNRGPMVEFFQATIGKPQGEAWCLALVQSCVAYVESFGFKSELFPTEHCLTAWINSKCVRPVEPLPGDLVLYRMGETIKGHAAVITAVNPKALETVEGNTGPGAGIEREGDGVFTKIRPRGGVGAMRELGFLRLF